MPLLFNMLFRLVIAFLPRSKSHLISWLQAQSAMILEPKKIKSVIVSSVFPSSCHEAMGPDSLIAQMVKSLPAMRETRVWFLGWEDPLEKKMAIHSSTLAWKIPWMEEPDRLQSMGSQRVGHDWVTSLSVYSCPLFLITSFSVRSIPFLSFIVPIFGWNIPLVSLIFLKRSLVFPILLFSSVSLH